MTGAERDAGLQAAHVHAGKDLGPRGHGQRRQSGQVRQETWSLFLTGLTKVKANHSERWNKR